MLQTVCIKIGLRMFHKNARKVRDNYVTFDTNRKSSSMFLLERFSSTKPVDKCFGKQEMFKM